MNSICNSISCSVKKKKNQLYSYSKKLNGWFSWTSGLFDWEGRPLPTLVNPIPLSCCFGLLSSPWGPSLVPTAPHLTASLLPSLSSGPFISNPPTIYKASHSHILLKLIQQDPQPMPEFQLWAWTQGFSSQCSTMLTALRIFLFLMGLSSGLDSSFPPQIQCAGSKEDAKLPWRT